MTLHIGTSCLCLYLRVVYFSAVRSEVISQHVPTQNDEWMLREMKRLVQFTRIFPLESYFKNASKEGASKDGATVGSSAAAGNDDNDENGDEDADAGDDGDDDGVPGAAGVNGGTAAAGAGVGSANGEAPKPPPEKSATYEEILYQVFLQDKRQTMRMRCPLGPSRAKSGPGSDTASLPPLDSKSSSSKNSAASASGRGIVGWKAPPKQERKEIVKVVTQTQLESAKRLSQGLSVAQLSQVNSARNRHGGTAMYGANSPSAVLIMDEYDAGMSLNQQQMMYNPNAGGSTWMQSRFQK
jgi:hypothetical protein